MPWISSPRRVFHWVWAWFSSYLSMRIAVLLPCCMCFSLLLFELRVVTIVFPSKAKQTGTMWGCLLMGFIVAMRATLSEVKKLISALENNLLVTTHF